jgi:hypothetical protein
VFENRGLRGILCVRGTRKQGSTEYYIVRSLVIGIYHQIFFGRSKQDETFGGSCTLLGRGGMCTGIWWEIERESDQLVDPDVYERVIEFAYHFMNWKV